MTNPAAEPATDEVEAVAKIIDPDAWDRNVAEEASYPAARHRLDERRKASFGKAVRILLTVRTKREEALVEALHKCRARFFEYADSHSSKGTPEGDAKALRNIEMAGMCSKVLAQYQEGESHSPPPPITGERDG